MGPHATAAFLQAVLNLTPAKKDWGHLRIVIDNNPHTPSRTPIDGMLESCRKLRDHPIAFIAIPGESAVIFVPSCIRASRQASTSDEICGLAACN